MLALRVDARSQVAQGNKSLGDYGPWGPSRRTISLEHKIVLFVSLLTDYTTGDPTPAESVAFLVDNQAALYIWNLVIFIVFSIAPAR
jgi:hypothetical protein